MIQIEHEIFPSPNEMMFALEGMRNAYDSWDKGDSGYECEMDESIIEDCVRNKLTGTPSCDNCPCYRFKLGKKDKELMVVLSKAGSDHRKFMRAMPVMVRITAPLYWWKEFDTYKVGTVSLSCSTMHTIQDRPLERSDFSYIWDLDEKSDVIMKNLIEGINSLIKASNEPWATTQFKKDFHQKIIEMIPDSYNQTRNITMNYEVLKNIYYSRKNHKLSEWRNFCIWIETIPYNWLIKNEATPVLINGKVTDVDLEFVKRM